MVCARAECPSAPALVADAEGARPACARQPEAKQGVWSLSSSTTLFPKLLRTSGDLSSCVWVHWLCAPVSPGFSRPSGGRRQLCVGEHTNKAGKTLHYKGCCFHRLIPDFMVQGGDITKGDGTGGESIYGPSFPDEGGFAIKHSARGLLSMANCGKNTNNSQFFITFKPAPWLDGKHVVFGRVIEGIDSVMELALVPRGANDRPKQQVIIKDCGEVLDIEKRREAEELRRQAEREAGKTEVEKVRIAEKGAFFCCPPFCGEILSGCALGDTTDFNPQAHERVCAERAKVEREATDVQDEVAAAVQAGFKRQAGTPERAAKQPKIKGGMFDALDGSDDNDSD